MSAKMLCDKEGTATVTAVVVEHYSAPSHNLTMRVNCVGADLEQEDTISQGTLQQCTVCTNVYDPELHGSGLAFEDLPESWRSPSAMRQSLHIPW